LASTASADRPRLAVRGWRSLVPGGGGPAGRAERGWALVAAAALVWLAAAGCFLTPRCTAGRVEVASGLTNPRGLARGPDGALYAAEAGSRDAIARVSRVEAGGARTVAGPLPRLRHGADEDIGASGVAFRGGELYVAQGEGEPPFGSALLRVRADGAVERIVDLLAYDTQYNPDGAQFESNPFGLIYDQPRDRFYVTDAAANDLLEIRPDGTPDHLAVWSNRVPTGLARGPDDGLYVALFSPFPHDVGAGAVSRVRRGAAPETIAERLTTPIGVAFDQDGAMYVLEFASGFKVGEGFRPRSGRLLRLRDGRREVIVGQLPYPTALLVEPDQSVLISVSGAMSGPGAGGVLRVTPCLRG
jgi:hypothetical protein